MKRVLIILMIGAALAGAGIHVMRSADAASDKLLIVRISLPIKKSKEPKVAQLCYDIWGPEADVQAGKVHKDATNWANSGWCYAVDAVDNTATSAIYCVSMLQTKYRATEAKKNEWKNMIGGVGIDIGEYESVTEAYAEWGLICCTNVVD